MEAIYIWLFFGIITAMAIVLWYLTRQVFTMIKDNFKDLKLQIKEDNEKHLLMHDQINQIMNKLELINERLMNYNRQIEAARQDIESLKKQVDSLFEMIEEIYNRLEALEQLYRKN